MSRAGPPATSAFKTWEREFKSTDPIFKTVKSEERVASLLRLDKTSPYPFQPPQCSPDHYYPKEVEKYGLTRFVPARREDLLPSGKRGVTCKEKYQCHGKHNVPPFVYVREDIKCDLALAAGEETVLCRWYPTGSLQACWACFIDTKRKCTVKGVSLVLEDEDEDEDEDELEEEEEDDGAGRPQSDSPEEEEEEPIPNETRSPKLPSSSVPIPKRRRLESPRQSPSPTTPRKSQKTSAPQPGPSRSSKGKDTAAKSKSKPKPAPTPPGPNPFSPAVFAPAIAAGQPSLSRPAAAGQLPFAPVPAAGQLPSAPVPAAGQLPFAPVPAAGQLSKSASASSSRLPPFPPFAPAPTTSTSIRPSVEVTKPAPVNYGAIDRPLAPLAITNAAALAGQPSVRQVDPQSSRQSTAKRIDQNPNLAAEVGNTGISIATLGGLDHPEYLPGVKQWEDLWKGVGGYQDSARDWALRTPFESAGDFAKALGPFMTMMREHQMNHSIWADTMEIAANRMQEGLIKAEAKKDKELEGLDTDRSTLQGQINGLKEDLEASERSGARLDAQVNGLKSALAEATSNREEQMAGVVSERDQALTDLAFSEKTRFQLRRQLEEEAKTRAGLESELRKVKERLALDAGDLAVLRQAEAARELLRHKSVGVQYAPRPPDLDLPPSSTPTHSPLPPPSA